MAGERGGFWQVHPAAADTLARAVLDALAPRAGDTVLDLYCGAGLFTGVLADAVGPGGTVTGIESGAAAVRDARRNLRATPWATVHQGDAAGVMARGLPAARLAVLDPPRAGAARDVIEYLARPARRPVPPRAADRTRPVSGGSPTSPVTRPPSPGTSPSSRRTAGGWRACARSTRSP